LTARRRWCFALPVKPKPVRTPAETGKNQVLLKHEAAAHLRISVTQLDYLLHRGEAPPFIALGQRKIGFRLAALERWMLARERDAAATLRHRAALVEKFERGEKPAISNNGDDDAPAHEHANRHAGVG
jgi:predicted DNA-binding transcriptional regulator AlpA